jgi:hypothetical protein
MLGVAKRLASDPAARKQALRFAAKAKPAVNKAMQEAKSIQEKSDSAFEMGRLAGRLKRKYLDDDGVR